MTMHARTYRCPYCYEDFAVFGEESDEVEMAPDCGHSFTLGEARRGKPDPANKDEVETLTERVIHLETQVAELQATVKRLLRRISYGGPPA